MLFLHLRCVCVCAAGEFTSGYLPALALVMHDQNFECLRRICGV